MSKKRLILLTLLLVPLAVALQGAENLRLNPRLNYSSDSQDGPLIRGDHTDDGAIQGKPNYIIFYGKG